ncbi:MAG: multicopper oxidase domain-containing protein [Burkholderiaceae bacterium]
MYSVLYRAQRASCRTAAILGVVVWSGAASAAPPDTLPPLKRFSAVDGRLDVSLQMERSAVPIAIGRDGAANAIAVDALTTLTVCSAAHPADCADPYAGAVLQLTPGDTLDVRLFNRLGGNGGDMASSCMDTTAAWDANTGWSSNGGLLNQHFHGLLVPPTAGQPGDPGQPFGDYIFTCTHGSGAAAERHYRMTLPAGHPVGIDWYHPHIHGIAKPQVASGMAGMLLVGDPPCSDPTVCGTVRPIVLKDAQLVKVAGASGVAHWLNFADQNADFCAETSASATNLGSCAWSPSTELSSGGSGPLSPLEGRWVFTLNGAQYPTIVATGAQVWRVQNASANITYRLSLRQLDATASQVVADASFDVLSMDGAGLAGTAGTSTVGSGPFAPQTREILLMPGSRADLLIQRPADGREGDLRYQLVNESFQAGFVKEDADVWPHVALAEVIFAAAPAAVPAPPPAASTTAERAPMRRSRAVGVPSVRRTRVPVQESAAARLRGTPLSRNAPELSAPLAPMAPLPQEAASAPASAGLTAATPGHDHAPIARWLREDCDGFAANDALAQADVLLQMLLPGHQPIASDAQRKSRYWNHLHFNPATTHRRIYFGIQDADGEERFVLGETLVTAHRNPSGPPLVETDGYGRPIGPLNPVVLTTFNPDKGLCVIKRLHDAAHPFAGVEQWELVNVSSEVHNFHIHQMKFTVARNANGQSILRTPSAIDLVQLPASLLLLASGDTPAELQHDTIVVPRGVSQCATSLKPLGRLTANSAGGMSHPVHAFMLDRSDANKSCTGLDAAQQAASAAPGQAPDGSGMILLNMSFDGDWLAAVRDGENRLQPARFVFHCHILEHEDKGMMHRIAVLDPAPAP